MRVLDLMNRPWALTEGKLNEIVAVYERHAAGEKFDVEGLRAAAGQDFGGDESTDYQVTNGVAIIPVEGVLSKRMNLFSYFSGGTSTQILGDMISKAASDPSVHSLLLSIDSPGGEVDGTQVCADAVKAAGEKKPVLAWVDGLCCSAAYWIAAQAAQIYIADTTTQVGSIGVVATHVDRSKANEMAGRKVTEVTAGKYKRIASTHAPLTPEGHQSIQDDLDYLYGLFLGAVSDGRGVEVDTVHSDMADGRVFIGQQAIDAGLVDGIASQSQLVTMLAADHYNRISNPGAAATLGKAKTEKGAKDMSFRIFATEADFTAVIAEAEARGKAAATVTSAAIDQARIEGAAAERDRIVAIESLPLAAHHSDLINKLKADGKTTPAEAGLEILKAEGSLQAGHAHTRTLEIVKPAAATPIDPQVEAAQRADAAADAAKPKAEDGVAYAGKIRAHIAKAKTEGRTISAAEADAEINAAK